MHEELIIAKLVVVALGFLIAVQAFRGYRRGHGRPLLFVGVGFIFISVGAVIEGLLFEFAIASIYQAGAIQAIVAAIGMLFVLYSLHAGSMTYSFTVTDSTDEHDRPGG